jgi:hypothetical protein
MNSTRTEQGQKSVVLDLSVWNAKEQQTDTKLRRSARDYSRRGLEDARIAKKLSQFLHLETSCLDQTAK